MRKTRRQHSGKGRQRNTRRRWYQQRGGIRTGIFANIPNNNNGEISSDDAYPAQKVDYITQNPNPNRMIIKVVPKTQKYYLYHAGSGEFHPVSSTVLSNNNNNNPVNLGNGSSYGQQRPPSSSSIQNDSKKSQLIQFFKKNDFDAMKKKFMAEKIKYEQQKERNNLEKKLIAKIEEKLAPAPAPGAPAPGAPAPGAPAPGAPPPGAPPENVADLVKQINQTEEEINKQNKIIQDASVEQIAGGVLGAAAGLLADSSELLGKLWTAADDQSSDDQSLSGHPSTISSLSNSDILKVFTRGGYRYRYDALSDEESSVGNPTADDQTSLGNFNLLENPSRYYDSLSEEEKSIVNVVEEIAKHSSKEPNINGTDTSKIENMNDDTKTIYDAYVNTTLDDMPVPPSPSNQLSESDANEIMFIKLYFKPFYQPGFINSCLTDKFSDTNQPQTTIASFLQSVTYGDFLNNDKITEMIIKNNTRFPTIIPSKDIWTEMKNNIQNTTFFNSSNVDNNIAIANSEYKNFQNVLHQFLIRNINDYLNHLSKQKPMQFYREIIVNPDCYDFFDRLKSFEFEKVVSIDDFNDKKTTTYTDLIKKICEMDTQICSNENEFFNLILKICGFDEKDEIKKVIIQEFNHKTTHELGADEDVYDKSVHLSNYLQKTIQQQYQSFSMPLSMPRINHIVSQLELKNIRIYFIVEIVKGILKYSYAQSQFEI